MMDSHRASFLQHREPTEISEKTGRKLTEKSHQVETQKHTIFESDSQSHGGVYEPKKEPIGDVILRTLNEVINWSQK